MGVAAGLDLSAAGIVVVAGRMEPDGLLVTGWGRAPGSGVHAGAVVDEHAAAAAIRAAVGEAERMAGAPIESVVLGVRGVDVRSLNSRGVIPLGASPSLIGPDEVERAVAAARDIPLPDDREIVHVLPQEYVVDDRAGIFNPLGQKGLRLEIDLHVVTRDRAVARANEAAVRRAGLEPVDAMLTVLATADTVLTREERELGVHLVHLGADLTDLAVFYEGAVRHTAVLPVTTPVFAGAAGREPASGDDTERRERIEERLTAALRGVRRNSFSDLTAAGMVLTGGDAVDAVRDGLAERVFGMPARLGVARNTRVTDAQGTGIVADDPRYAAASGLARQGGEPRGAAVRATGSRGRMPGPVRRWLEQLF